jgi:hypothetical protein
MNNEKLFCMFAWKKEKLTDPKCICLKWEKLIFDDPFIRLKIYLLQSLLSLISFSWELTLSKITPRTKGKCDNKKFNPNIWNDPQWLKVLKQSWEYERI